MVRGGRLGEAASAYPRRIKHQGSRLRRKSLLEKRTRRLRIQSGEAIPNFVHGIRTLNRGDEAKLEKFS